MVLYTFFGLSLLNRRLFGGFVYDPKTLGWIIFINGYENFGGSAVKNTSKTSRNLLVWEFLKRTPGEVWITSHTLPS